jgi:hypothetical protein
MISTVSPPSLISPTEIAPADRWLTIDARHDE